MFTSRKPTHLMIDSFDHYKETAADDRDQAGGEIKLPVPAQIGVACKWDDKTSSPFEDYLQRDTLDQPCFYLCDATAFDAITENDYLLFNGNWYRVMGAHDQMGLGRCFRLDVQSVITPAFVNK